jgi:hypothetical protein
MPAQHLSMREDGGWRMPRECSREPHREARKPKAGASKDEADGSDPLCPNPPLLLGKLRIVADPAEIEGLPFKFRL